MLSDLLSILRNVIWPAVVSVLLTTVAIITAIVAPDKDVLVLALSLGAITLAVLAQMA